MKKLVNAYRLLKWRIAWRVMGKILIWEYRHDHPQFEEHLQLYLERLPDDLKLFFVRENILTRIRNNGIVQFNVTKDGMTKHYVFNSEDAFTSWFDECFISETPFEVDLVIVA